MNWWLPRTLITVGAMLLGALVGNAIGELIHAPRLLTFVGGVAGVAIVGVLDALRGRRLLQWVRGPQVDEAPRETGFWGELGYRVERSVRQRDQSVRIERLRLEQFLSAIEASPNGVMMLDALDRIDWCNAVSADHFGLDPRRDRLHKITNLVRAPAFVAYLSKRRYAEPVVFPAPNGRSTLSVMVRPYGEGMKLVLSQDVTERERAEAMRRDFVANVSHEIRTPLTVLAGYVETLAQLDLADAERRQALKRMGQQTDRMQALVADLLTLAQLEGSPSPGADRWIAVDALMQRVRLDAEALSGGRHEFVSSGGADAEVAASQSELLSALGNLVNNAVRYTPQGGQIELRWSWRGDGSAELAVIDAGIGIAREHIPRLTERFYRVDSSRSRDTGGTGLGLSIVKHVAQRHGGEIDVQSEPGKGSCFKLVLPPLRVRRRQIRRAA